MVLIDERNLQDSWRPPTHGHKFKEVRYYYAYETIAICVFISIVVIMTCFCCFRYGDTTNCTCLRRKKDGLTTEEMEKI